MQPIRIAVGDMPHLLREIILSALSPHADLEVIESELTGAEPPSSSNGLDVLMLSSDGARLTGEHEQLLWRRPRLRILLIDGGGRQAALYELRTHCFALRAVSTENLIGVIRDACTGPRAAGLLNTHPRH